MIYKSNSIDSKNHLLKMILQKLSIVEATFNWLMIFFFHQHSKKKKKERNR